MANGPYFLLRIINTNSPTLRKTGFYFILNDSAQRTVLKRRASQIEEPNQGGVTQNGPNIAAQPSRFQLVFVCT